MGFGLVASPILVGFMGLDPRLAVAAISAAQVATSIPLLAAHVRAGNVSWGSIAGSRVAYIALGGSAGSLIAVHALSGLEAGAAKTLYAMALIPLVALLLLPPGYRRPTGRGGRGLLLAVSFAAGAEKAATGGGLSPILALAQQVTGASARESIAVLPLAKIAPLVIILLGYIRSGYWDTALAASITMGAAASILLAPRVLRVVEERYLRVAIALVLIAAVARALAPL